MAKIWSGGASKEAETDLSDIMTAEDAEIDSMLLDHEVVSLIAYQLQLREESIISNEDSDAILLSLLNLLGKKITIDPAVEDVHGFVEEYMREKTGDVYKNLRIFLSRNEQSHIDIRSFYIDHLLKISKYLTTLSQIMFTRKDDYSGVMPGYTHNRQAMPIRISTYFDYFSRIFLDMSLDALDISEKFSVISPLGYGSGFGSLSPIDFSKVSKKDAVKEALRLGIIAELDAISLYEQLAMTLDDEGMKKVFMDVAKEEKTHVGEFQALLLERDKEQVEELRNGKNEVEELTK